MERKYKNTRSMLKFINYQPNKLKQDFNNEGSGRHYSNLRDLSKK